MKWGSCMKNKRKWLKTIKTGLKRNARGVFQSE